MLITGFFVLLSLAADPAPDTESSQPERGERVEALVRFGVQRVLSRVLDVPVEVGEVKLISDEEGLELHNVRVGNPKGFEGDTAFTAETVRVDADVRSLLSREPEIRLIKLAGAHVNAQAKVPQGSNLSVLMKNARNAQPEGLLKPRAEKNWLIQRGVLEKATVSIDAPLLQKEKSERTLDDIEMTFGEDGHGIPAQQAVAQFVARLLDELDLAPTDSPAGQVVDLLNKLRKK